MYMLEESNTELTRTCEKPFTEASILTIRPPGRYKPKKLMKYDRLGGFTCAQFLFWESQCGGELGQLVQQKWAAGPNKVEALWNMYLKIVCKQESCEWVIEVFRCQGSKQMHKGQQSTEKCDGEAKQRTPFKSEGTQRDERKMVTRACLWLNTKHIYTFLFH